MFEKLLLAITLTLSLNLFLGLNRSYSSSTFVGTELQERPTQSTSQLLAQKLSTIGDQ